MATVNAYKCIILSILVRHGVISVPELKLMGNSNSGTGIAYFKKNGIGIDKCQSYLEYKLLRVGTQWN
jgi:hypothetical protein